MVYGVSRVLRAAVIKQSKILLAKKYIEQNLVYGISITSGDAGITFMMRFCPVVAAISAEKGVFWPMVQCVLKRSNS